MTSEVLVLFSKHPNRQKVKTRIGERMGAEFAKRLSLASIKDIVEEMKKLKGKDVYFVVDTDEERQMFREDTGLDSLVFDFNGFKGFSEKFNKVFGELLGTRGYKKAVLIPTDILFLNSKDAYLTFRILSNFGCVFGPEENGGVYLIGLRAPFPQHIFREVRWSTEYSFLDLLRNSNGDSYTLRVLRDLNTPEDVLDLAPRIPYNYRNLTKFLSEELSSQLLK